MVTSANPNYKEELWKRLDELNDARMGGEIKDEWTKGFISSVHTQAFRYGVLSLSPKQISKVEELHERYCG